MKLGKQPESLLYMSEAFTQLERKSECPGKTLQMLLYYPPVRMDDTLADFSIVEGSSSRTLGSSNKSWVTNKGQPLVMEGKILGKYKGYSPVRIDKT